MFLRDWVNLPQQMQTDELRYYYQALRKKRAYLFIKSCFSFILATFLLLLLSPLILILAIGIKIDSKGPVFYLQSRHTQYGRVFKIVKFRTMVVGADRLQSLTSREDQRVTRLGQFLRKTRLDELPQLFNILKGDMSFVGTRPEITKYVEAYTPVMRASLLLRAGITSRTSLEYQDEASLIALAKPEEIDDVYVQQILPEKMKSNLRYLENISWQEDFKIICLTAKNFFT